MAIKIRALRPKVTYNLPRVGVRLQRIIQLVFLASMLLGCLPMHERDEQARLAASPEVQRQYDAAFQDMLRQPADLEVLFKFAKLATELGDLEGAISAMERMLLIDPDLPQVRLELGILYYRLKSYDVAVAYLQTALNSSKLPQELRPRAEQVMARAEKRVRRTQ